MKSLISVVVFVSVGGCLTYLFKLRHLLKKGTVLVTRSKNISSKQSSNTNIAKRHTKEEHHGSVTRQITSVEGKEKVLKQRNQFFCGAQSVSYANSDPLYAVQGDGQFIIDDDGQRFLDTRNNVAHVGWQNPRVVEAIVNQSRKINCNTRYIHHLRGNLAQRLLSTFPPHLTKVFFVNSGSEANDLALRLARTHTGHHDVIVADHAYHGHTVATLEISPYKYLSKGGNGKASHIHQVLCPNVFKRQLQLRESQEQKRKNESANTESANTESTNSKGYLLWNVSENYDTMAISEVATEFSKAVEQACINAVSRLPTSHQTSHPAHCASDSKSNQTLNRAKSGVAALMIESIMSVGGVIFPPAKGMREAFAYVHRHGGVCIVDEVQSGFGRVGAPFWGFALTDNESQSSGLKPDIVTMGKPFGNGFPLGAVVCTDAVAASFENGMEYFNTFGGNPVACAAGLAVLEEIRCRNLPAHAAEVGAYLCSMLRELANEENGVGQLIGDVRGVGLFIGIEFMENRWAVSKEASGEINKPRAAIAQTSILCSRLKERHNILTSIDGPEHNVLVLKPPLVFSRDDATRLVRCIRKELPLITAEDVQGYSHTST